MKYEGSFYKEIGNFLRENYLDWGFTKGTKHEVDFLVDLLGLPEDARILDIGCGPGRHSLELARRGYRTLGIDISDGFIDVAKQAAEQEGLSAMFQVADARNLDLPPGFDAVICLCEGAFGLAGDEAGHRQVLAGIHKALRPGGKFVLTVINALNMARGVDPAAANFDAYSSTCRDIETVTSPEGESREVEIYTTAFTYRELKFLLEEAGFAVDAAYGVMAGRFERKPLAVNDMEIMMVASRR